MRAFSLGVAALLAGCGGGEQQLVENHVRAQLAPGGNVTEVSMQKQADGGYRGHAMVRLADGNVVRVNCAMRSAASGYEGMCGQVIDARLIETMRAAVRQQYQAQGLTVVEVDMAERNADTMAGHAILRDANGAQLRVNCTAPRDQANGRFGLTCEQAGPYTSAGASEGGQAAEAPAPVEEAQ